MTNIQDIMKYFTSIFGFFLLIIVPLVLVYKYRQRLAISDVTPGILNKSWMNNNYSLLALGVFSVAMLVVIIINLLTKNTKICVADSEL